MTDVTARSYFITHSQNGKSLALLLRAAECKESLSNFSLILPNLLCPLKVEVSTKKLPGKKNKADKAREVMEGEMGVTANIVSRQATEKQRHLWNR